MINELKTFFNNLKTVRKLINENVGDTDVIDAINNREYIYIYYGGDDSNKKGYRTIRPFVLGTHKSSGNKVLRAWQDRGRSHDFDNKPTRPDSLEHDYWIDNEGIKPGWRLFRLDKIEKVYPTGRRFLKKNGEVMIPPKYNENDTDMSSVVVSISPKTTDRVVKTSDDEDKTKMIGHKVDKSDFDKQSSKFKQFYDVGSRKRDATSRDVENLYNIVKNVWKKSPNNYFIAIDDKDNFQLINIRNKDKFPEDAIVGDLTTMYSTMVEPKKGIKSDEKKFFNDIRNDIRKKSE